MNDKTKKVIKALGNLISLISILFILSAIVRLGIDFSMITDWVGFSLILLLGILIKMLTVVMTGSAWADWLHLFSGRSIDMRAALAAYLKANVGKYLPGNVMHYVERNLFAANLGIGQKKMALSSLLEVIGLLAVAFVIALAFSFQTLADLLAQLSGPRLTLLAYAGCAGALCAAVLAVLMRKRIAGTMREFGTKRFIRHLLLVSCKYAVALLGLGLIMVILYAYMGSSFSWRDAGLIESGYVIAWVVGFVLPGASGGIGVRELAINTLLAPVTGPELILTLSVIHRLITIIGDFAMYFVSLLLRRS